MMFQIDLNYVPLIYSDFKFKFIINSIKYSQITTFMILKKIIHLNSNFLLIFIFYFFNK